MGNISYCGNATEELVLETSPNIEEKRIMTDNENDEFPYDSIQVNKEKQKIKSVSDGILNKKIEEPFSNGIPFEVEIHDSTPKDNNIKNNENILQDNIGKEESKTEPKNLIHQKEKKNKEVNYKDNKIEKVNKNIKKNNKDKKRRIKKIEKIKENLRIRKNKGERNNNKKKGK